MFLKFETKDGTIYVPCTSILNIEESNNLATIRLINGKIYDFSLLSDFDLKQWNKIKKILEKGEKNV